MTGPLDPYASHANYSLYIREVSSVSGWITDPLHPGLSAGLYSYTRFFTPPGVQICTLPITEWELNHSGACENWCTQLILVEVPLVFPAFAHHMHTFPCFAEHHYTDSEQMSILGNVLQAFTPGCNVGAMWVQCVCNAQERFSIHITAKRAELLCKRRWHNAIHSDLETGTRFHLILLWEPESWCQVRAESLLFYSQSQLGISRIWTALLPCDHYWRAAPTEESSQEWNNGGCFINLSIKSLLNVKKI